MEQRFNFVTLIVGDLDASRRFYADGLGWKAAIDVPGEVLMFHVGHKVVLSLWAQDKAAEEIGTVTRGGTPPITLAHNCANPETVDQVLEDARRAGADPAPATQREWGGYSGYFADPDGFRWEVAFNPHPVGDVHLP